MRGGIHLATLGKDADHRGELMKTIFAGIALLTSCPAVSDITVFSDKATWASVAGGPPSIENFEGFEEGTSFLRPALLEASGFWLQVTNIGNTNNTSNAVGYLPFPSLPVNDSLLAEVDLAAPNNGLGFDPNSLLIEFEQPVTAFGADFFGFGNGFAIRPHASFTFYGTSGGQVGAVTVNSIISDEWAAERFLGFHSDDEAISWVHVELIDPVVGNSRTDVFYIDDFGIIGKQTTEFKIRFPVSGYGPYTAPLSSVMDHSGPPNRKDGVILAFTGEVGDCQYGIERYKVKDQTRKSFDKKPKSLNEKSLVEACEELKTGQVGTNGYLYAYLEAPGQEGLQYEPFPGDGPYMYYDGHAGYDYSYGEQILAVADGILCVTRAQAGDDGSGELWRNEQQCPYGNDAINTDGDDAWQKAHTFYILHPESGGLSSWYLHSEQLDAVVENEVAIHGFAVVRKGQPIATMGGYWNFKSGGAGKHLHFEVRRDGSTLVDPYGWQGSPVLWE